MTPRESQILAYFTERLEAIQMDERLDHAGRVAAIRRLDEHYHAQLAMLREWGRA